MDLKELFNGDKLDTTRVSLTRFKCSELLNITNIEQLKKESIHFYLNETKEFHHLLLPKFYAALVIASQGDEEDDLGAEYTAKGEYSFIFKMQIPHKEDSSKENLYYFWFMINNLDGIYAEILIPQSTPGEIITFKDFVNPSDKITQMITTFTNIWIITFQGKGLIPYPYVKFCDQLLYMFGYSEKDSEYFYHKYEDEKKYKKAKKTMTEDLIKELH